MGVGEYDDPNDLDMRSTISSASTSKLLGKDLSPRKYRTHTLRTFLRSPGEENRARSESSPHVDFCVVLCRDTERICQPINDFLFHSQQPAP